MGDELDNVVVKVQSARRVNVTGGLVRRSSGADPHFEVFRLLLEISALSILIRWCCPETTLNASLSFYYFRYFLIQATLDVRA